MLDKLIIEFDKGLKTLTASAHSVRPHPDENVQETDLSAEEMRHALGLMRINHCGEVCAQALYNGQSLTAKNPQIVEALQQASKEETEHLAWCEKRIHALGGHTSLLNPLWYAGAFAIGYAAGKLGGDQVSLGFVVETEHQVEAHLNSHMQKLPEGDTASRAIVAQMKADEIAHAQMAQREGAVALPAPIQGLMKAAAKVMTTVAHRL